VAPEEPLRVGGGVQARDEAAAAGPHGVARRGVAEARRAAAGRARLDAEGSVEREGLGDDATGRTWP
jgi:hypothetical protein